MVAKRHPVGEARTVCEVRHDQLAEMADAKVDLDEPARREPMDDQLEHRALSDRHERLRQHHRVRPQARTSTAREDHGPHR